MQKTCLLNRKLMVIFTALFLYAGTLCATARYVATNSTPVSPFTNWANAVGAYNTIIHGNTSPTFTAWTNWSSSANFTNCCIGWQSSPTILGANNFTNAPEFIDPNAGNFHLSRSSPCVNTGTT